MHCLQEKEGERLLGLVKESRYQKGSVTPSSEHLILSRTLGDGWAEMATGQAGPGGVASWPSMAQVAVPHMMKSQDVWAGHLHRGVPPSHMVEGKTGGEQGGSARQGGKRRAPELQDKSKLPFWALANI